MYVGMSIGASGGGGGGVKSSVLIVLGVIFQVGCA
jgi:hypothetical protein